MKVFTKTKIIGALTAMILGLVTWVISHEAVISLILGLLVEVVALLVELHVSMAEEFERFDRAAELRSLLVSANAQGADLLQYVREFAKITESSHPFIMNYARERVLESVEEMRNLGDGRMEVGPSLVQVMGTEILRNLKVSGFATALGHLYDFWLPESGGQGEPDPSIERGIATQQNQEDVAKSTDDAKRRYQMQGLEAVRNRNIPITRVFLLERPEIKLPPDFLQLIDDQNRAGVKVLVAYLNELDPDLKRDVGIWDDQLVVYVVWEHSVVSGPGGRPILTSTVAGATYYTSAAELIHARRLRDRILQKAVRWSAVRPSHTSS